MLQMRCRQGRDGLRLLTIAVALDRLPVGPF